MFPLVPKHRLAGLPFGGSRACAAATAPTSPARAHTSPAIRSRRSTGERARGFRPRAAATSSSSASASPRRRRASIVLCDRRPSMGLYPPPFPWLSKPAVVRSATESIVASADSAHAPVGYLDYAGANDARRRAVLDQAERARDDRADRNAARRKRRSFDAPDDGITRGLDFLGRFRSRALVGNLRLRDLGLPRPADRRVDLADGVGAALGGRARGGSGSDLGAELPPVGGLVLPLSDVASGQTVEARLSRREARARRDGERAAARRPCSPTFAASASTRCCSRRACPRTSTGPSSTGPSAGAT